MSEKICTIMGWEKRGNCWTNIGSPDFVREQKLRGYLETQRHGFINLSELKKNSMRVLWHSSSESLRQGSASDSGFIVWGHEDLSGSGSPKSHVLEVRESEDGETGMDSKQSLLHEAVYLLCGAEVSWYDGKGCSEGVEVGLEKCEGIGQGVYGEAALSESCCCTPCHWNRRNIIEERTYLSDSSERLGAEKTYLVWGKR